jgi:hypothetical protein
VKRITFSIAGLCLLAMLGLGCGSNSLKTITLQAATTELKGIGATIQLGVQGNYSYGPSRDLTSRATYTIIPEGTDWSGQNLATLATQVNPSITIDNKGMMTAVDPALCTFEASGTTTVTGWFMTGDYKVIAHFGGIDSQPMYFGVASAAGDPAAPGSGLCGP